MNIIEFISYAIAYKCFIDPDEVLMRIQKYIYEGDNLRSNEAIIRDVSKAAEFDCRFKYIPSYDDIAQYVSFVPYVIDEEIMVYGSKYYRKWAKLPESSPIKVIFCVFAFNDTENLIEELLKIGKYFKSTGPHKLIIRDRDYTTDFKKERDYILAREVFIENRPYIKGKRKYFYNKEELASAIKSVFPGVKLIWHKYYDEFREYRSTWEIPVMGKNYLA